MFDDEGFLAGLGRKLIKCIPTGSRLPQNSSNQLKTTLMAKNSSTAQNGSEMEVAMVEVAAEVMVVLMARNQEAEIVILSFGRISFLKL